MTATYAGIIPFVAHTQCPRGSHWRGTFPYHVFSLTLGGGTTYTLPTGSVEIIKGDLLHFAPQAIQDWQVDGSHPWKVGYLITALPAALRQLLPAPTLAPGIGRIHLDPRELTRTATSFRDMQQWCRHPSPVRGQLVLNLLEHVLLRLYSAKPASETDPRIAVARDFLHANVESPALLADVARVAGLSRARLCALFKEHLGGSPMAYLERLRLEQAARLLVFSSDDIAAIAERLGYSERGYFEKRFKRHWGMTPKAYRMQGVGRH